MNYNISNSKRKQKIIRAVILIITSLLLLFKAISFRSLHFPFAGSRVSPPWDEEVMGVVIIHWTFLSIKLRKLKPTLHRTSLRLVGTFFFSFMYFSTYTL